MARRFFNSVVHLASFIALGCAVAIIVITAVKLFSVSYTNNVNQPFRYECLLSPNYTSKTLCGWTFAVAGLTLILAFILSCLRCITCNLCGCGNLFDLILAGCGTAAWVVYSVILQHNTSQATTSNLPEHDYRLTVQILAWVATGAFAVMFIAATLALLATFCACLGCCVAEDEAERGRHHRANYANKPQQQFMVAQPAAAPVGYAPQTTAPVVHNGGYPQQAYRA